MDAQGGFFLGGDFFSVGGREISNLDDARCGVDDA